MPVDYTDPFTQLMQAQGGNFPIFGTNIAPKIPINPGNFSIGGAATIPPVLPGGLPQVGPVPAISPKMAALAEVALTDPEAFAKIASRAGLKPPPPRPAGEPLAGSMGSGTPAPAASPPPPPAPAPAPAPQVGVPGPQQGMMTPSPMGGAGSAMNPQNFAALLGAIGQGVQNVQPPPFEAPVPRPVAMNAGTTNVNSNANLNAIISALLAQGAPGARVPGIGTLIRGAQ